MRHGAARDLESDKTAGLFDLTGKVAIVTGGAGAIGHAAVSADKALCVYGADDSNGVPTPPLPL